MEASFDVFLSCLPQDVNDNIIRNLFRSVGKVTKVKILDDKKNENHMICYIGFETYEEAENAVKLANKSMAFGEQVRASISRKSVENYDQNKLMNQNNDFQKNSFGSINEKILTKGFNSAGRGRGLLSKRENFIPSFTPKSIKLTDIKLKNKEMIDIEIVDLSNLECICARPIKHTENSKAELIDLLNKVNSFKDNLQKVDCPKEGDCYLGKWDDGQFYRAELLNVLENGTFKVTFVDEGTYGDIVSEIRHIPEGPLQQYPKQFTKISLGCKDSDKLRDFIIEESNEKKVSLFWLGGFYKAIPLINLFLSDVEVIEKFILLNKENIRDSFALKFKDMPNHNCNIDCSNITLIQSMYKSQADFTVQIREPETIQCQRKTPFILPTPGDVCIYEKRNGVNNVTFLRCVVKRRQLLSFDVLLFDSGEHINNVSIDCIYAADDCHKVSPPFAIICELDKSLGYCEDTFQRIMSDENMKFSIITYKGNNRYLVSASVIRREISRYPEINLKKFMGQSNKVLVTHLVSPLNFFVQLDRSEYVQTLNDIHERINICYNGTHFTSVNSISIGQAVVAPFSVNGGVGENFRATVLEIRAQSPQVHVYYIDYGNDGWVDYKQLLDVDEDIVNRPPLALNCTLDVDLRKEAWNHAIELFSKLVGFTDNDSCELVMQVTGDFEGKLIVDLMSLVKGSISMALVKSGTCMTKDNSKNAIKPVCNGDVLSVPKVTVPLKSNVNLPPAMVPEDLHDFESLLTKVDQLEKRLAYLEKFYQS